MKDIARVCSARRNVPACRVVSVVLVGAVVLSAAMIVGCQWRKVDPNTLVPADTQVLVSVDGVIGTLRGVGGYAKALVGGKAADSVRSHMASPAALSFDMFSLGGWSDQGLDPHRGILGFRTRAHPTPVLLVGVRDEARANTTIQEIAKRVLRAGKYETAREGEFELHIAGRPFGKLSAEVMAWSFHKGFVWVSSSRAALLAALTPRPKSAPAFFDATDVKAAMVSIPSASGIQIVWRDRGTAGALKVIPSAHGLRVEGGMQTPAGSLKALPGTPRQALATAPAPGLLSLLLGGMNLEALDAPARERLSRAMGVSVADANTLLSGLGGPFAVGVELRGGIREVIRLRRRPEAAGQAFDVILTAPRKVAVKPEAFPKARFLTTKRGTLVRLRPGATAETEVPKGFKTPALVDSYLDKPGAVVAILRPHTLADELLGLSGGRAAPLVKQVGSITRRIGDVGFVAYPEGPDYLRLMAAHRIRP